MQSPDGRSGAVRKQYALLSGIFVGSGSDTLLGRRSALSTARYNQDGSGGLSPGRWDLSGMAGSDVVSPSENNPGLPVSAHDSSDAVTFTDLVREREQQCPALQGLPTTRG